MLVLPIGGADMPVVISLLNAFTGLSAAATGVALSNPVMIVARDDRRRVGHDPDQPDGEGDEPLGAGDHRGRLRRRGRGAGGRRRDRRGRNGALDERRQDVAIQLAYARLVVIAPGYGMAVAQAQHAVRELQPALEARGSRSNTRSTRSPAGCPVT